jgi:hypothetical protein
MRDAEQVDAVQDGEHGRHTHEDEEQGAEGAQSRGAELRVDTGYRGEGCEGGDLFRALVTRHSHCCR